MEGFDTLRHGLEAAADEAFREIKKQWKQMNAQTGALDSFKGFLAAVDWSEPWLIALLVIELCVIVSLLFFRKQTSFQGAVMLTAGAMVYNAERINKLLGQHWQSFAGQPYFDEHGIFIGAVFSAPLLLMMFIALVNYLIATSHLLIQMKRKELRHKARQRSLEGHQSEKKAN